MKVGSAIVGIIITGALGYLLEPSIRPALLKVGDEEKPGTPEEEAESVVPEIDPVPEPPTGGEPVAEVPDWVLELTPDQLPERVTLTRRAMVPVEGSDEPMVLPAGASVTTVRVEGEDLVISPFGGPMEGSLPIASTDLVAQLGDQPPEPETTPEVAALEPEMPAVETPEDTTASPTPDPEVPEPVEPESVEAESDLTESAADRPLSEEEIVSAMQESVKSGSIREFTFEQVLGWKATEDHEAGGETYQSGLITYKAETIFGVKDIQARALIKEGKVVKWIWPNSGMEIN